MALLIRIFSRVGRRGRVFGSREKIRLRFVVLLCRVYFYFVVVDTQIQTNLMCLENEAETSYEDRIQSWAIIIQIRKPMKKYKFAFSQAKERIDTSLQLREKARRLSDIISNAKYPIFLTGAGISTSVGIPDYRSGEGTVVGTGPGVWNQNKEQAMKKKPSVESLVDRAIPSLTHMAIKTLLDNGTFKFLVSQNTDGLHLRSGVRPERLAELHGNRNLETCIGCKRKYFRDFRTLRHYIDKGEKRDHFTGRRCENCNGQLHDSIIYFGEKLPIEHLGRAFQQAAKSDLCLCIGSSLTVKPSVNVPLIADSAGAKLCIVNIQETPLDSKATLKINSFCDEVMSLVMKELKLQIAPYRVQHYLEVTPIESGRVRISGKDHHWNNFTFIKSIETGGQNLEFSGYQDTVKIDFHDELVIHFFGPKPPARISTNELYKVFHGESMKFKLERSSDQGQWRVEQI